MAAQATEEAYCTLVMSNSYLPGAIVLAHSLRDAGTTKKLAAMITLDTLSADTITKLKELYDVLIPVERIRNSSVRNLALMDRTDLVYAFTKIALWRQLQFRRIVYLDADVVALRAPDELFDIDAPFAAAPDVGWPDAFNTGVMVISPNAGDYWALRTLASSGDSFDGADQGLLNQYFQHRGWRRLSFTYNCTPNAQYQWEPAYQYFKSNISMVHFIGKDKPWRKRRPVGGAGTYNELLSRWWAVHDRHAAALVGQPAPGDVSSPAQPQAPAFPPSRVPETRTARTQRAPGGGDYGMSQTQQVVYPAVPVPIHFTQGPFPQPSQVFTGAEIPSVGAEIPFIEQASLRAASQIAHAKPSHSFAPPGPAPSDRRQPLPGQPPSVQAGRAPGAPQGAPAETPAARHFPGRPPSGHVAKPPASVPPSTPQQAQAPTAQRVHVGDGVPVQHPYPRHGGPQAEHVQDSAVRGPPPAPPAGLRESRPQVERIQDAAVRGPPPVSQPGFRESGPQVEHIQEAAVRGPPPAPPAGSRESRPQAERIRDSAVRGPPPVQHAPPGGGVQPAGRAHPEGDVRVAQDVHAEMPAPPVGKAHPGDGSQPAQRIHPGDGVRPAQHVRPGGGPHQVFHFRTDDEAYPIQHPQPVRHYQPPPVEPVPPPADKEEAHRDQPPSWDSDRHRVGERPPVPPDSVFGHGKPAPEPKERGHVEHFEHHQDRADHRLTVEHGQGPPPEQPPAPQLQPQPVAEEHRPQAGHPPAEPPKPFSAPPVAWDATRFPPPTESQPEAANFPSQQYEFSEDRRLFHPPTSYPEPPKDMWYQVPEDKPKLEEKPKPIFPWELRGASRPSRVFEDDQPLVTEQDNPPVEDVWEHFQQTSNVWDSVPAIGDYVRKILDARARRAHPQVIQPEGAEGVLSPEAEASQERRESIILTDFPTAVERPSLPVTPAPIRRPTFWGEERDEAGQLPAAEGVPDQADWNPVEKLEALRRSSLTEFEHLKSPETRKKVIPLRELPEHSLPAAEGKRAAQPLASPRGSQETGAVAAAAEVTGTASPSAGLAPALGEPGVDGRGKSPGAFSAETAKENTLSPTER